MKKGLSALVLIFCLLSCSDGVEFNNPTLQGIKDGQEVWKTSNYSVDIDSNGFLTITGSNSDGTLTLNVPSVSIGTYVLGSVSSMEASFQDNNTLFSTSNIGDRGPFNFSDGEIVIEEIDFANNIFTGTFRFNAYNFSGATSINFIEGIFYRLPLSTGSIPSTIVTCSYIQVVAAAALINFQNVDTSNAAEYLTICQAYKIAIQNQLIYCGDAQGALQDIINALGDCIL